MKKYIKYNKKTLIIKEFSFSDIGLKKLRKNSSLKTIAENSDKFACWVIQELKKINPNDNGKKYSSLSIYMSSYNVKKLEGYLDSLTWLNFAPIECDYLDNEEYGVDLTKMFEE